MPLFLNLICPTLYHLAVVRQKSVNHRLTAQVKLIPIIATNLLLLYLFTYLYFLLWYTCLWNAQAIRLFWRSVAWLYRFSALNYLIELYTDKIVKKHPLMLMELAHVIRLGFFFDSSTKNWLKLWDTVKADKLWGILSISFLSTSTRPIPNLVYSAP